MPRTRTTARKASSITRSLHAEIERILQDRRPLLLKIVHSFREGIEQEIEDVDPGGCLRQALREAKSGRPAQAKDSGNASICDPPRRNAADQGDIAPTEIPRILAESD